MRNAAEMVESVVQLRARLETVGMVIECVAVHPGFLEEFTAMLDKFCTVKQRDALGRTYFVTIPHQAVLGAPLVSDYRITQGRVHVGRHPREWV